MAKFLFVASLAVMTAFGASLWLEASHGLNRKAKAFSQQIECGLARGKVYWTQC